MSPSNNRERRTLPDDMKDLIKEAVKEAASEAASEAVIVALSKSPVLTQADALALVRTAMREMFVSFGANPDEPIEMQKDFQHLRAWRESVSAVKTKGLIAAVGVIVVGTLGLIWLGLQTKFGIHVAPK